MKDRKKQILDELDKLSPLLWSIKREVEIDKDESYFENMQTAVFNTLKEEKKGTDRPRKSLYWISGIAASLLLVFGISQVFWNNTGESYSDMASLEFEEMMEYISDNVEDYELESIYALEMDLELDDDYIDDNEIDVFLEENLEDLDDEFLNELL